MSQNQQLFLLANVVSVNTAANTTSLNNSLVVGNSSVNVVINSSSVYVSGSPVGGATNTAAQYAWTNTQSFSAVVTHTANVTVNGAIIANATSGTAGQVLTSAGAGNVYWSTASGGGGGFTNGQSISVNNFVVSGTVTANGSVGTSGQALVSTGTGVQWGALSPGYNYSSQFNGSNYLAPTYSSLFDFGSGNFTVEFWVMLRGTENPGRMVNAWNSGTSASSSWEFLNAPGYFQFNCSSAGTSAAFSLDSTGTTISNNTWYHLALVRNGNVFSFYINGSLSGTTTNSLTIQTPNTVTIGARRNGASYVENFTGLISNLRVVKGTAVYTSAFTAPTLPLSAITNTSLLTCNSIIPTGDSSINAVIVTNSGTVISTASYSPFTSTTVSIPTQSLTAVRQQFTGDGSTTSFSVAGGYTPNAISVFVNGVLLRNGTEVTVTNGSTVVFAIAPLSGALIDVIGTVPTTYSSITPVSYSVQLASASSQYLSIPANAAFQMTADFTYECWLNLSAFGASGTSLFDQWVASTSGAGNFELFVASTGILYFYYDGNTSIACGTLSVNTWYHVAAVRSGSSIKVYVNGILANSVTFSGTVGRSDTTFWIGAQHNAGPVLYPTGYISNVRVVKGLAVYTNNFTVPSSPLAITQSASGAYIQAITGTQTSLLTCNGPTIIDGSTNAFTITNNGSAPVSTAIVPTFTNVTINNPSLSTYQAAYLVVAGGGAGGYFRGGGGGAGGLLTNSTLLSIGTTYTITVGAGGTSTTTTSTNGGNSLLGGVATAIGGGRGGNLQIGGPQAVSSGGSGGGGGGYSGGGEAGGAGTSGQGFAGGSGYIGGEPYGGGGGGGAGAVGQSNTLGAAGGAGLASTITGASVTYAGGGGAGGYAGGGNSSVGVGGAGGGGTGTATNSTNGGAGTVNTGSGGGGGPNSGGAGGAGGSGVVIIAVPYANYTGTTTGSPTVTTVTTFSGTYKILTFTASGSYTA